LSISGVHTLNFKNILNFKAPTPLEGLKRYELKLHNVLGACSQLNFNFRHIFKKGGDLFKLRVYTYKKVKLSESTIFSTILVFYNYLELGIVNCWKTLV
jgi:hypothetical protein